jgi:CheY-like chemotaxis protein
MTATARILLLDDDKFLLDMYAMKFAQQGYTVHTSLSASDALGVLRQGFDADAILFDITMPEMDGFAFLQTLQTERLGEKAKKIILSNQSSDEEREKGKELGADLYIVKANAIPSEVVNMVGEALKDTSAA